jgi:hypothetical protein
LSVATESLAARGWLEAGGSVDVSLCVARELLFASVRLLMDKQAIASHNLSSIRPGGVHHVSFNSAQAAPSCEATKDCEVVVADGSGEELARFWVLPGLKSDDQAAAVSGTPLPLKHDSAAPGLPPAADPSSFL